jgi:hypothetical protein
MLKMQSYATEDEFIAAISGCLPANRDMRAAIAEGIAVAERAARADESIAGPGLGLRIGTWVLREADLPVVEIIGMVAAAATIAAAPAALTASAAIGGVAAFAGLCWRTWRRGASLSRSEVAVLGFLQLCGPMTLAHLLRTLPTTLPEIAAKDVEKALKSLTDVELRDGHIVALVREDASGRWRTSGL